MLQGNALGICHALHQVQAHAHAGIGAGLCAGACAVVTDRQGAGAFILNYTLQFIRPLKREDFLKKLYAALRPGGILLLSEKTISHDSRLNREYIDIYHQFKKSRGYSELEIAKKREALENVLIPFSIEENLDMLRHVGFTPVQTYFQWFNFASLIAVKPA